MHPRTPSTSPVGAQTTNNFSGFATGNVIQGHNVIVHLPAPRRDVPRNVPPCQEPFVDRDDDRKRLDKAVSVGARKAGAYALITGMPGVGKASLARAWAAERESAYPDGQLYVDLAGARHRGATPYLDQLATMAIALGIDRADLDGGRVDIQSLYRSAVSDHRVLVVVENARNRAEVAPYLPSSTRSQVLVTADGRLGDFMAPREAQVDLEPLEHSDARSLVERLVGEEHLGGPVRTMDDLLDQCGGLPLALVVAAGHLQESALGVDAVVRRLLEQADMGRVRSEAWQAVHALFDQTYESLSEDQRRVYECLGLLPSSRVDVAMTAAMADLSLPDVMSAIDALFARRLIAGDRDGGLRIHIQVRNHARLRSGVQMIEHASRAQVRYVRGAVAQVDRLLTPVRLRLAGEPADPVVSETLPMRRDEVVDWVRRTHTDITAVQQSAVDRGELDDAWAIGESVWALYRKAGLFHELCDVYRVAVRAAEEAMESAPDAARARDVAAEMRGRLGYSLTECGELDEGESHIAEAKRLLSGSSNALLVASMGEWWATYLRRSGRKHEALVEFRRARSEFESLGHVRAICLQNYLLGATLCELGRYDEAIPVLTDAMHSAEAEADHSTKGRIWLQLGVAHAGCDDGDAAGAHLDRALEIAETERDARLAIQVLEVLADQDLRGGRHAAALGRLHQALGLCSRLATSSRTALEMRIADLTASA